MYGLKQAAIMAYNNFKCRLHLKLIYIDPRLRINQTFLSVNLPVLFGVVNTLSDDSSLALKVDTAAK